MKLIVQPEDGAATLLHGIENAAESIEIAIFRFDHVEVKRALERAVARGVSVHALIADTNHGSEKNLRKLETEFLAAGIEVSRTARDLLRHHYKFMVVDRKMLYLLTFNFTYLDMDDTRSFGLITEDHDFVGEALRLFYADIKRQPYKPALPTVLVSPVNARHELARFLRGAEEELLIYDPEVSDRAIVEVLRERDRKGVAIRIIGRLPKSAKYGATRQLDSRVHTRAIVRDRRTAFLGSQSLRERELDRRRELGLLVDDPNVVASLVSVFEYDWRSTGPERPAVTSIVESAARKAIHGIQSLDPDGDRLRREVAAAVRKAMEDTVYGMVKNGTSIPT
jgi:cardiolipin synthase